MKRMSLLALAVAASATLALADGTGSNRGLRKNSSKPVAGATSGPEVGLLGVKLYDTGLVLINKFGSPDEIQDVAAGTTTSIGPSGGGPAGAAGGARGGGGGRGGESEEGLTNWNVPQLDWKPINFQGPEMVSPQQTQPGGTGAPAGAPAGRPAGGQPAGGGGVGGGSTALNTRVVYTRWVYRRGNSRYAFILNRYNQIIQIEAIGMSDPNVSTRRGIRYGSQFGDIMKKYGAPDGYEIGGNTLVVRYLVDHKVAFRLNRLKTDGKHQVTGIVVAAGKM